MYNTICCTGTPPPAPYARATTTQEEEQEERAEALAGGLWGAEHGRVLHSLASTPAAAGAAAGVSPFLPSTHKRQPTQVTRPLPGSGGGGGCTEAWVEEGSVEEAVAKTVDVAPIDTERSALAGTLPAHWGPAARRAVGKGAFRV